MKSEALRNMLAAMAETPGVRGCALVEIDAGMVWHACGEMDNAPMLAEAASDYWRLYQRLSGPFSDLGELQASMMVHARGRLTLMPCGKDLLLVAVMAPKPAMDWRQWQVRKHELAQLIDDW